MEMKGLYSKGFALLLRHHPQSSRCFKQYFDFFFFFQIPWLQLQGNQQEGRNTLETQQAAPSGCVCTLQSHQSFSC